MLLLLLTSVKTVNVLPDERAEPSHKTPLQHCCFDELIHERVSVWHISTTVECECDVEPVKKTTASMCNRQCPTSWDASVVGPRKKNFNKLDE